MPRGCLISNLEGLLAVVILFPHIYLFSLAVMSRTSYRYSIGKINIQSTYLCPENLRTFTVVAVVFNPLKGAFKLLTEMEESKCQDLFFHS